MPSFSAHAPGKIILFGEHAVVYGQPAIAVPVTQVQAIARVTPDIRGKSGQMRIQAPNVGLDAMLDELDLDHPLAAAIEGVIRSLGIARLPSCTLNITSTIPVASGLGSGAAVSVAVIRAVAGFLGHPISDKEVSTIAFEVEKIHHGTPSGIDNTVVTYAKPVFFTKGQPIETFNISQPFNIIIADTGIASPTKETVSDVRLGWQANPKRFETLFSAVGSITRSARTAIESGHPQRLGPLMDENQELLQEIGVSSPEIHALTSAAKVGGALGAKLSGGGRGGNIIAISGTGSVSSVFEALKNAGGENIIKTRVGF